MTKRDRDQAAPGHQGAEPVRSDFALDELVRPRRGARGVAFVVDGLAALLLSTVAVAVVWFAFAPWVPSLTPDLSIETNGLGIAANRPIAAEPGWYVAIVAGVILLGILLFSGALSQGSRTSLGFRAADLEFSVARPARWRVAMRWIAPFTALFVAAWATNGLVGLLLVILGWAPCLFAPHRSLYDWVAGLTVVDPVATKRRSLALAREASGASRMPTS